MTRMQSNSLIRVVIIFILKIRVSTSIDWDQVKCSTDVNQNIPEGKVEIGRFHWLGVVQHTFRVADKDHFAVTTGVLIHPGYIIAAADDIARIPRESLFNNTKFIVWYSETLKYAIEVVDYVLHPEYEEKTTFASLALLELYTAGETGLSDMATVVLPVCLPLSGVGTFDSLYAARISDDEGEIGKESLKMNYYPNKDCEEYYFNAELLYEKMRPRRPMCAMAEARKNICVWDAGVALITRQSWGHWMLLGFSMRGPGCGAPAQFLYINEYVPWIDEVLSRTYGMEEEGLVRINFRRQNPHKILMYKADVKLPKEIGQCDRALRGPVVYKENSEVVTTKNFAQGFYFVSVSQLTGFVCMMVNIEALTRSNPAVWIENLCHRDNTGLAYNQPPSDTGRLECFVFFRTNAYVELRFFFSFRAMFEVTIYGEKDTQRKVAVPNPFNEQITTDAWWPTNTIIDEDGFKQMWVNWNDV